MDKRFVWIKFICIAALVPNWSMAEPKAPTKVCLELEEAMQMILVTKPAGPTIQLNNGNAKFLDISGELCLTVVGGLCVPFKGSGRMIDSKLHLGITTSGYNFEDVMHMITLELLWNVETDYIIWMLMSGIIDSTGEYWGISTGDAAFRRTDCSNFEMFW